MICLELQPLMVMNRCWISEIFLESKGVDLDKNEPVGIELYNLDDRICVRFICKEQGNRLVAFELKDSLSLAVSF